MAAFLDDTYRITPRVTLSLGLRYELTPPWADPKTSMRQVQLALQYSF